MIDLLYLRKDRGNIDNNKIADTEGYSPQKALMKPPFGYSPVSFVAKEDCLKETKTITDDELVGEVYNLKNPRGAFGSTGKDRARVAHEKMFAYLVCRVGYEKKDEIYNLAKNFIQGSTIKEENKKVELDKLNKIYNFPWNIYFSNSLRFYANIAMGEVMSMCKTIDIEANLKDIESSLEKFKQTQQIPVVTTKGINIFDKIKILCKVFDKYTNNTSSFIKTELNDWADDREILERQMTARSAAAFYLGGKGLALEVCGSVPWVDEELRNFCLKNIAFWVDLKRCQRYSYGGKEDCAIAEECETIRQELAELICKID